MESCNKKDDNIVINIYHIWSKQHCVMLSQSLAAYDKYNIFIPRDIIFVIELHLAPKFDIRIPYFPYPSHLFNNIKKEFFYYQIRIALIGTNNVGKSSIILQHITNSLIHLNQSIQSIGYDKNDMYFGKKTTINHNNKNHDCQLSIYKDHAMIFGERNDPRSSGPMGIGFPASRPINVDIYLLVFDLLSQDSFTFIINTLDKIQEVKNYKCNKDFCVILVGNKCDTIDTLNEIGLDKTHYLVSREMINTFCMEYQCPFIECSASQNIHIEELFDISVKEAIFYKGESMHF